MRFTANTEKLGRAIATASKGSGRGKFLPITAYAEITLEKGTFSITCTDGSNFVCARVHDIKGEDGKCIVNVEQLNKLVQKTSVEEMTFSVEDDCIKVTGNGNYNLPLLVDEKFPKYSMGTAGDNIVIEDVKLAELIATLGINKCAVSNDKATPQLTGYLIGEKASVSTTGALACNVDATLIGENSLLLSQEFVALLPLMETELVKIVYDGEGILIDSDEVTIYGAELKGKDEYPDVSRLLALDIPYSVEVDKDQLQESLDRISIFTDKVNNIGVVMSFEEDGLSVSDKEHRGNESIKYTDGPTSENGAEDVECLVSIELLQNLLSSLSGEKVRIDYGSDLAIRISEGNITQVLALLVRG